MKNTILMTASVIALLAAAPAFAETKAKISAQQNTTGNVAADVEKAWEDVKENTAEAYENVKAAFIDDDKESKATVVTIDMRHTAAGMIGKAVYNSKNERIGTVKDIIVDANGKANMVIIADGEFPGYDGKLVAFDYNVISHQNADGDVIAPLSEESISKTAEFSYDRTQPGDTKVRMIPENGFSVAKLLEGQLVNPQGETVAEIDNISFKNGHANQLIVGFDRVLGLGGKNAAIDYNDAKLVRKDGDLDFQLSANHALQFESYKTTASN